MSLSPRTEETDRYLGSLYRIDLDRSVTSQVIKIDISNGIAWTPDNKTQTPNSGTMEPLHTLPHNNVQKLNI